MKKYKKPVINTVNIQSADIITTSEEAVKDDLVGKVAIIDQAKTQTWNFYELFDS